MSARTVIIEHITEKARLLSKAQSINFEQFTQGQLESLSRTLSTALRSTESSQTERQHKPTEG